MTTSTDTSVREAIMTAIGDIAVVDLGFDAQGLPNIRDYPLEHERAEARTEYLMTDIGAEKVVRAISVWVLSKDDWHGTGDLQRREYRIEVALYYDIGFEGSGAKLLVDHARKIRGAIRLMTCTLDDTVDLVSDSSELSISRLSGVDPSIGEILVGSMQWDAVKLNPDF